MGCEFPVTQSALFPGGRRVPALQHELETEITGNTRITNLEPGAFFNMPDVQEIPGEDYTPR